MNNFQDKYFEAINSLIPVQEENYKLKNVLSSIKESAAGSHDKYEKIQESLIESLDVNAKLEAKVAQLKKDKVSLQVGYKREIAFLKEKLEEYQVALGQIKSAELSTHECTLCKRSCNCHLSDPAVHTAQKLKFMKSTPAVAPPVKVQEVFKENVEKLKPKNVKLNSVSNLISWRSVVKESRPKGTLTFLTKKTTKLIEEGIMNDFLVDRVENELLADCIAEEGNKSVPAIPKSLVEEFDVWLDSNSLEKKDDNLESWMDIVSRELGQEVLGNIVADMDYHHRVLKAVRLYLKRFAPHAKIPFESCFVRKLGDTENVPAIPKILQSSFLKWFEPQLAFAFYEIGSDSKKRKSESVFSSVEVELMEVLLEPYNYLLSNPGKEIRTTLILAFEEWVPLAPSKREQIIEIIKMLHSASLMIDDVEDNSSLRRSKPVAHKIYGIPATINCANYVYFLALEKLSQIADLEAINVFTQELIQLHRGQGMEIYWRDSGKCPTEEEYVQMVQNKTGGLLRLAVKLMQLCSERKNGNDYTKLVNILGTHFQIRDDYMNLMSGKYEENKGFAEDLTEGKFSFPIIHCIRSNNDDHQILSNLLDAKIIDILRQRTQDVSLKKHAIKVLEASHSFDYTKSKILELEKEAREEIQRLGGNSALLNYLKYLEMT